MTHMGYTGAGQVAKLCNQVIVASNLVTIAEAISLAERSGIDATKLHEALAIHSHFRFLDKDLLSVK